jgi:hypothetical protein
MVGKMSLDLDLESFKFLMHLENLGVHSILFYTNSYFVFLSHIFFFFELLSEGDLAQKRCSRSLLRFDLHWIR